MNAQVNNETNVSRETPAKNPLIGLPWNEVGKVAKIGEALVPQVEPILERIRQHNASLTDTKNLTDTAGTERKSLWADTLAVAELVYAATVEVPSMRDYLYSQVMAEFLGSKDRNTAKAYASTAKTVLSRLWTEEGKTPADVKDKPYADIRAMLRPVGNPQAEADAEAIRKMLAEIKRFGDKHGIGEDKSENSATRLARIREFITPEYNAVKGERDKASAAAKAARELKALQQQAPREAGTVETAAAKPEAVARAA